MRALLSILTLALLFAPLAQAEDATKKKTPVVTEIKLKGRLPFRRGRVDMPKVLKSAEAVAKALPGALAMQVSKAVDFGKQHVVLFQWGGSGQDKLTTKITDEKKGTFVFQYRAGLTRDFRPHVHAFAVRKGAKWEFKRLRFQPRRPRN